MNNVEITVTKTGNGFRLDVTGGEVYGIVTDFGRASQAITAHDHHVWGGSIYDADGVRIATKEDRYLSAQRSAIAAARSTATKLARHYAIATDWNSQQALLKNVADQVAALTAGKQVKASTAVTIYEVTMGGCALAQFHTRKYAESYAARQRRYFGNGAQVVERTK